jgi:hypothetical protein
MKARAMARRPWYDVLGVSPVASADEVRDAYLALVKAWHPDRFATVPEHAAEAEERVKMINAAYDEARSGAWAAPYHDPSAWDAADWPEWMEVVEPARIRLLFVPGGLVVRAVALALALVFTFLAVAQAVNALDLVIR